MDALRRPDPNSPMVYTKGADWSVRAVEADAGDRVQNRDEGWERWKGVMGERFLRGDDRDFTYDSVDENDAYDDREEENRRRLSDYLAAEKEQYVGKGEPEAQTGVQDF